METAEKKENKILKITFKVLKITILVIFSLIFITVAGIKVYSLMLSDEEILELDDSTRAELDGNFIQLNKGYTNYELAGNKTDQAVVFVHGFFMPSFIWDANFYVFADSGFNVLRYDNYGRGYSDRPETEYSTDLYTEQLYELLMKMDVNTPVDLIGSSHGGLIVMAFTEKYPEMVRKVVLVNPAGFTYSDSEIEFGRFIYSLVSAVGIPKIIMNEDTLTGFYEYIKEKRNIEESALNSNFERAVEQLKYKGLRNSVYSFVNNFEGHVKDIYENVAKMDKDILLVWGEKDLGIPISTANAIIDTIPEINYIFLPEDGHTPHVSNPDEFNRIVINFLNK
jgi:pimeloyl-ACP methyl ester carboxylesterase